LRLIFPLILFLLILPSFAEEFHLLSRIEQDQYYRDLYPLIHEHNEYSAINHFKNKYQSLNISKRKKALNLVNELNSIIPSPFLRPLIHWKLISPDKEKLAQVMTYIMTYKAHALRDYYQSPLLTSSQKTKAKELISSIYHREDFTKSDLVTLLTEDFNQKSEIITSFKKMEDFITAIKETEPLSFNFLNYNNITPYTLNFSGFIPGNQVEIFSNNFLDVERMELYSQDINFDTLKFNNKEHPAFKTESVFVQLKKMIKEANHSIFISVKDINGSLGLAAMKHVINQTKEKIKNNPNFKVLILNQEDTPFIHFIKNQINSDLNLNKSIHIFDARMSSKKNNSKVIVIDANTERPTALIGSKNWSDHNGGYYFDNSILVKGPGAALIQNSFYHDLKSIKVKKEILDHFKISRKSYPYTGDQTIRLTESSLDNKINNSRDTLIDMIKNAKSHIYMEQLYLYDTYIINALIKRKMEVPEIDIRILADHNNNIGLNGLPNTIYLRELKLYNIQVKARMPFSLTLKTPKGVEKELHQENHRNTISVDGKTLHTGSASMSPESLQGHTREIGIQIYDTSSIRKFETNFLISWNDRNKVMDLDIENFRAKNKTERISREISSLINAVASKILAAKDEIINQF